MMPVLVMGLAALGSSIALVIRPTRPRLVLVVGCAVLTLLSGGLGTAAGLRSVARSGELDTQLGSCLHPILMSFVLVVLVTLLATVGAYRLAKASEDAKA